jgi:hypothetical protein
MKIAFRHWNRNLALSRKCNANCGKRQQKCGKRQQMEEKVVCGKLPQLADFVRLATPLARFGKVDRTATNQKVGSSNPPGRSSNISLLLGNLHVVDAHDVCNPK